MDLFKNYYINVSDSRSSKTKSLTISKVSIAIFAAIIILILGLTAYSSYISFYKFIDLKKISDLEKENSNLKTNLEGLNSDLDSIQAGLKEMENWEDKIRRNHGLKEISSDIRKVGTGGYPDIDSTFVDNNSLHTYFNDVRTKLINTENKLRLDLSTHKKLADFVSKKKSLYEYMPSIYPTFGRITSAYGYRQHPILKKRTFHSGLDFGNKTGTAIYSTAKGTVLKTGSKKLLGKYVLLKHKYGYKTKYGHLDEINVAVGDTISKGQIIGKMGNTGRSTGPHLHYEILRYGKLKNPWYYLKKEPHEILTSNL